MSFNVFKNWHGERMGRQGAPGDETDPKTRASVTLLEGTIFDPNKTNIIKTTKNRSPKSEENDGPTLTKGAKTEPTWSPKHKKSNVKLETSRTSSPT